MPVRKPLPAPALPPSKPTPGGPIVIPPKPSKEPTKQSALASAPLNFLLQCPDAALDDFYLARMNEMANVRKELYAVVDRLVDQMAQAELAQWFRTTDRQSLKAAIYDEESAMDRARRMIRERGKSDEELIPLPKLEPG